MRQIKLNHWFYSTKCGIIIILDKHFDHLSSFWVVVSDWATDIASPHSPCHCRDNFLAQTTAFIPVVASFYKLWCAVYLVQESKGPKAVISIKDLNITFQPEKIGHSHGLQITFQDGNHTRNLYVYHESAQVGPHDRSIRLSYWGTVEKLRLSSSTLGNSDMVQRHSCCSLCLLQDRVPDRKWQRSKRQTPNPLKMKRLNVFHVLMHSKIILKIA